MYLTKAPHSYAFTVRSIPALSPLIKTCPNTKITVHKNVLSVSLNKYYCYYITTINVITISMVMIIILLLLLLLLLFLLTTNCSTFNNY